MALQPQNLLPQQNPPAAPAPDDYIKKSYRYIRLSMVAMVLLIILAIFLQSWTPWTFELTLQSSISAYYYTAARPIFVACLVAIGVCLIALKGSTDREDLFLNLAGVMAPVVAFIPTPRFDEIVVCPEGNDRCQAVRDSISADIFNNFVALLIIAWVIFAILVIAAYKKEWPGAYLVGLFSYLAGLLVYTIWFCGFRESFQNLAHYISAGLLFLFVWIVVLFNAKTKILREAKSAADAASRAEAAASTIVDRKIATTRREQAEADAKAVLPAGHGLKRAVIAILRFGKLLVANRYGWVASAMLFFAVVVGGAAIINAKSETSPLEFLHLILWLELLLIIPFGVFWFLQTLELGNESPLLGDDAERWAAALT